MVVEGTPKESPLANMHEHAGFANRIDAVLAGRFDNLSLCGVGRGVQKKLESWPLAQ